MTHRYISLFAGAGGLDLGLMRAGLVPSVITDEDMYACQCLRAVTAGTGKVVCADVHDLINSGLFGAAGKAPLTLAAGQPPLLPGGGTDSRAVDPDGDCPQLLYRFMDAVAEARPAAFMMTGSPALTGTRWSAVMSRLRAEAGRLGYAVSEPVIDAADLGVPQHRRRLVLTGMPAGTSPAYPVAQGGEKVSAGAALRSLKGAVRDIPCTAAVQLAQRPDVRASAYASVLLTGPGRVLDLNRVAPALPPALGGNKTPVLDAGQLEKGEVPWIEGYHGYLRRLGGTPGGYGSEEEGVKRMRRLTLRECAALQGLPPAHPFHGPAIAQFRLAGGAVPPAIGEAAARAILAGLK